MGAHHRGAGFVLLPTGQSQPQGKGGDSCSQGDELVCTGPAFPGEHGWGRKQQRPKGTCFSYCPVSGGASEWGQARLWWLEGPFRLCAHCPVLWHKRPFVGPRCFTKAGASPPDAALAAEVRVRSADTPGWWL